MRALAVLLLLAVAVPASAQHPRIIGFTHDGTVTWTNSISGGYYAIESKPNLSYTWCPFTTDTWNQVSLSCVATCKIDMSILDGVEVPIPGLEDLLNRGFLRVVVSSNQIPMPIVTSTLRMVNHSSQVISNVIAGSIAGGNRTAVTNIPVLPTGGTSEWVAISCPYVFSVAGSGGTYYSDGWYVTYDQDGTNRFLEVPMIALGPPRKEIVGIVSNNSITATWTWLNWTNTKEW